MKNDSKQLEIFDLEPGFYRHVKHDPSLGICHHTYEFLNIAHHTEVDGLDESALVIYQPLYDWAPVYKKGKHWDARPQVMFLSDREDEQSHQMVKRFTRISDPTLIAELVKIRNTMYGDHFKYYTGDAL